MILRKRSPKGRSVRVTFELPADAAQQSVAVAGSFNDWDTSSHPMVFDEKRSVWTRNISFRPGSTIEFRYFVDGNEWVNEAEADSWEPTPFFSDNNVLAL